MSRVTLFHCYIHRRRLVINIGGKNLGHKYWGCKNFGKMFSDNILKKVEKIPFYSLKFLTTFFSHQQLFFKNLHSSFKIYSLFSVFFFLCLCFCFLSCFFKIQNKIFSSDYWEGGQKIGFAPILILGGVYTFP